MVDYVIPRGAPRPTRQAMTDHFPDLLLKTLETELELRAKDRSGSDEHIRRLWESIRAKREAIELALLSASG